MAKTLAEKRSIPLEPELFAPASGRNFGRPNFGRARLDILQGERAHPPDTRRSRSPSAPRSMLGSAPRCAARRGGPAGARSWRSCASSAWQPRCTSWRPVGASGGSAWVSSAAQEVALGRGNLRFLATLGSVSCHTWATLARHRPGVRAPISAELGPESGKCSDFVSVEGVVQICRTSGQAELDRNPQPISVKSAPGSPNFVRSLPACGRTPSRFGRDGSELGRSRHNCGRIKSQSPNFGQQIGQIWSKFDRNCQT